MSISRSQYLVATLVALLASRGIAPEAMDPWRGWVTFKQFAREVVEYPDQGVSVQITSLGARGPVRLVFLRQLLAPDGNRLEPVGGVVWECWFAPRRKTFADWEAWTFDFPTFDRFVDEVEQYPDFAELLTQRATSSDVYWEDA